MMKYIQWAVQISIGAFMRDVSKRNKI